MKDQIASVAILIYLWLLSVDDLKHRSLPAVVLISSAVVAILYVIIFKKAGIEDIITGILPGVMVILSGLLSKESIGIGDGVVLMVIGIVTGMFNAIVTLMVSGIIAAIFSAVMLAAGKVKMKQQIPFIPFLLVGYIVGLN